MMPCAFQGMRSQGCPAPDIVHPRLSDANICPPLRDADDSKLSLPSTSLSRLGPILLCGCEDKGKLMACFISVAQA